MSQINFESFLTRLSVDLSEQDKGKTPTTSDILKQLEHVVDMGFYARPTRFAFSIDAVPSTLNDRLLRNCMSLVLPGRSFMSQGFKIYGSPIEQVYETNYSTEISMTFRVGEDMLERDFFEGWMNIAMSYETADVAYPDDYMTSMRIYQMNRNDGYVYGVRLNNVFCKTVSDMELSSDASDQISTVNITLGYTDYAVIGKIGQLPTQGRFFRGFSSPPSLRENNREQFSNRKFDGEYTIDSLMKNLMIQ